MVLDGSAVLAIFFKEPEQQAFVEAINAANPVAMSVANLVECSMVIESRFGAAGVRDLDQFIARAGIEITAIDIEQGQLARSAFSRFGKGHHRAALNFGDCFAYAAAITFGEPLLCKGNDFIHTDVPILDAG